MITYNVTHHVSRVYTLELRGTNYSVHVTRYRQNGKRQVTGAFSAYVGEWTGRLDVNMGIDPQWARNQLHDWHSRGFKVSTFTIRIPSHTFGI